jgi:acetoin utilization protein AcuC
MTTPSPDVETRTSTGRRTDVELIHTDDYLAYSLGEGHPTRPIRASNLIRLVDAAGLPHVLVEPVAANDAELLRVHAADYVAHVRAGWDDEWEGPRPYLHELAARIAGGTLDAARRIVEGRTVRAFHPMGAKHHAQRDRASGFCIYNDMALAAVHLADAGLRVLYVDWDAHHGDGVEALLHHRVDVLTASIHNGRIFPGTGQSHDPTAAAFNWPLPMGADGGAMLGALDEALEVAEQFAPDVVLLAAGADGHRDDPLGGLNYEIEDFAECARRVSAFSYAQCGGRLLAGGAGGYLADDVTPAVWFAVFDELTGDKEDYR